MSRADGGRLAGGSLYASSHKPPEVLSFLDLAMTAEELQDNLAIRSADDPTNGNGNDVDELVPPGVVRARVCQAAKIAGN